MRDGILEKLVSDHSTLEGLTQFRFCRVRRSHKLLILNTRRDVRVVEGARLKRFWLRVLSTPTRTNALPINDFPQQRRHQSVLAHLTMFDRSFRAI